MDKEAEKSIQYNKDLERFRMVIRWLKEGGITHKTLKRLFMDVMDEHPIEHVGYSPEQCGREK